MVVAAATSGCGGTSATSVSKGGNSSAISRLYSLPASPFHEDAIADSTRSRDGSPGPRHWTQHVEYDLHARLIPDEHLLEGSGVIVYHNRSPHHLSTLEMELSLNVHAPGVVRNTPVEPSAPTQIRRITVGGRELSEGGVAGPRYVIDGTRLSIFPPVPVAAESEVEIEIEWLLEIPARGAAGRMGHDNDELYFLGYWYPTMSVYDDVEGWHTDPFRGSAEFYHEFGDFDVTFEAPREWIVHATGRLENPEEVFRPEVLARLERAAQSDRPIEIVSEDEFGTATTTTSGDQNLTWRFVAERVPDFTLSASRRSIWEAARTAVGDVDGDGVEDYTLVHALYRPNALLWRNVVDYGRHAISFFSEFTGVPYPWPHITAVEGSPIETGGMEFPMMTLIGNYNGRGDSALYAVVAHELAHQWVPMIVGPNERRYGWIDEGLTTYGELAARHQRDPAAMHRLSELQRYILIARRGIESEIMQWSDYHRWPSAEVVAVYFKPTTVFTALREVLGAEVFDEAYRTFLREWSYRHPYPDDFFATFERISGRNLDWFWRSWFFETWQLDQAIAGVEPMGDAVVVVVENVGQIPMPVRLAVELEDGRVLTRTFDAEKLWLDGQTTAELRVRVDEPVVRVEIDPEMYFPDVERSNNIWWAGQSSSGAVR